MVRLHVKKGDESQFLYDTTLEAKVDDVIREVTVIYNGRLKISRLCYEIEELAKHGTLLPDNIMGLTDEQVEELKLHDEWGDKCVPSGGWTFNKDVIGRRNGRQPNESMQQVLKKTIEDARAMTSKKLVGQDKLITLKIVQEALDLLRGAVTIVYPMGLPPHDVIRKEFENTEDLEGTQASLEVMDVQTAQLWFSGKELMRGKKLSDFLGRNEKTKVTVKLHKRGAGKPGREPLMSEDERKRMMMHAFNRQEQLKVSLCFCSTPLVFGKIDPGLVRVGQVKRLFVSFDDRLFALSASLRRCANGRVSFMLKPFQPKNDEAAQIPCASIVYTIDGAVRRL